MNREYTFVAQFRSYATEEMRPLLASDDKDKLYARIRDSCRDLEEMKRWEIHIVEKLP